MDARSSSGTPIVAVAHYRKRVIAKGSRTAVRHRKAGAVIWRAIQFGFFPALSWIISRSITASYRTGFAGGLSRLDD
jgi:hypothetical protein